MNTQTKYFPSRCSQIVPMTAYDLISTTQALAQYQEIVFIDSQVEHHQQLISGVVPGIKTIILDPERDSIDQISAALSIYTEISTVHIVSHGDPGCLYLGDTKLNQSTLDYYTEQLSSWFSYRKPVNLLNPKILIYGCHVAAGDTGVQFITKLANLAGAHIAATAQPTGNNALGGTWELEVTTSDFEFALAFEPETMANYESVLATFTVSNTNDSGEGSLRQAILDANANGEADVITFNIPATELENDPDTGGQAIFIRLDSILPVVTETITIDGSTQTAFSGDTNPASTASGSESTGPEVILDFSNIPPLIDDNTAALEISAPNSTIDSLGFTGIRSGLGGDNAVGIRFDGRNADGSILSNSTAYENASHGIYVDGSFNVELRDNVSRDNVSNQHQTADGIHLTNTENITITNNQIYRNGGSGIDLSERGTDPGFQPNINILIDGNILNGNGVGAGDNEEAGVAIRSGSNVTIRNNTISQNLGEGIYVKDENFQANINNTFSQNSIFANGRLGIDLGEGVSYGVGDGVTPNDSGDGDGGANNLLNFPEFTSFVLDGNTVTVEFDLDVPAGNYRLEFFTSSSGNGGEGETFVNFLNINHPGGSQSFSQTLEVNGEQFITATVTEITGAQTFGNTSEFSAALEVSLPDNFNPVANDDSYTVTQDTILSINAAQGVILGTGGDTDGDGDALVVDNPGTITTTANGTVNLLSDGSFEYTPNSGFTGIDTFTYTISDGQGGSDTATVTVNVNPPDNSNPVAAEGNGTTVEDIPINFNVLDSSVDPDGDPLVIESVTDAGNGTVTIDNNGTPNNTGDDFLTYTPNSGFTGIDTFTYTISDGQGGSDTATVTVEVNPPDNSNPVAAEGNGTTVEDTPIDFNVLENAADPDGDPLTIESVTDAGNGTVTIDDNGTPNNSGDDFLTYTPNSGFTGIDTFTYTISDGQGGNDTATVTVEVNPSANNPPTAAEGNGTTVEDTPIDFNVLENAADPDGDPLVIESVTDAGNGTVTIDNNGTPNNTGDDFLTYTPNSGFTGIDTFTYTISDGQGGSDTATVTVEVNPPANNPPTAAEGNGTTVEDTPIDFNVLENAADPDGDPLTIESVTDGTDGTVTIDNNGTPNNTGDDFLTYTPNSGFTGIDTFTYTISDGQGGSDTATVTVDVVEPSQVVGDNASTTPDTPVDIDVLGNDIGNLTITDITQPNDGTVTIDDNGTPNNSSDDFLTYTPNSGFTGTDSFGYTATDDLGNTGTATVTVNVEAQQPNAVDDNAISRLSPVTIDVLSNDSDPNQDILTVADVSEPNNGTVEVNDDGTVTYTPRLGFIGTDSFTYTVSDGDGNTDTASVNVQVTNTNVLNDGGEPCVAHGVNDILTIGGGGDNIPLRFTLNEANAGVVNEVGVFLVDDTQGTIDGIAPGEEGYTEAALESATVIFSALEGTSELFGQNPTRIIDDFDSSDNLSFYLIQNSSTDEALADLDAGLLTTDNIFFASNAANSDGLDHVDVDDLGNNSFAFHWEDTFGGGDLDFNDLSFTVATTNDEPPLGSTFQGESQQELIDLTSRTGEQVLTQFFIDSNSDFANLGGLYQVVDASGAVLDSQGNLVNPGDEGYAEAALAARVVEFGESDGNVTTSLAGGFLYAPYVLADGETGYFPFVDGNGDGFDHLRLLADNTFGFEDTAGGGDSSFDDFTFEVYFPQSDANLIDLTGEAGNVTVNISSSGDSAFTNQGGLYRVENASGGVLDSQGNLLNPGDDGYAEAALAASVVQLGENENSTVDLAGGALYASYILADGNNPYFPFTAANGDGVNHVRRLGDNRFGFEDIAGGGDFSYDDFVIDVDLPGEDDFGSVTLTHDGDANCELVVNGDNNVFTIEGTGENQSLKFTLTGSDAGFVNEVVVFQVNEDGSIGEGDFTPGDEGYLEAALDSGTVVFSALSNNPIPLGGEASRIIDGFDAGDSLGFLFIQNSTADQVLDDLATGNDAAEVFFATTAANDAGLNAVEISTIGNSGYQLAWEDNPGVGDGDFNDLVFSVALTDEEAPLGNDLQGAEESEIIDLTDFAGEQVQLNFNLETNSQSDNTVGLYAISDSSGTVVDSVSGDSFAPGDEGYGSAVANAAIATLTEDGISSISLDGGELYATYLTTEAGDVFVPFSQGNGDSVDHVRLLADNTFGFEDVLGGGDFDYNDAVLGVEVNVI